MTLQGTISVDFYVIDQLRIKYFYILATEENVPVQFNST